MCVQGPTPQGPNASDRNAFPLISPGSSTDDLIAMEITAMPFGLAKAPEATASATPYHPGGFAKALGNAQSGAPPGSSPPTTGAKVAEEVAKHGPNAQSQE